MKSILYRFCLGIYLIIRVIFGIFFGLFVIPLCLTSIFIGLPIYKGLIWVLKGKEPKTPHWVKNFPGNQWCD